MRLRFLRDTDLEAICVLLNEVPFSPRRPREITPARLRQELLTRAGDPYANFLVVEDPQDGGVAGFCGYDPLGADQALMEGPMVSARWREQGLARRLWHELSALMASRGIRTVSLVLGTENEPARRFAERLGFQHRKTDVIVVANHPRRHEVDPPAGVEVGPAPADLDLAAYEDVHARLFTRRSPAFVELLARAGNYLFFTACEGPEITGFLELEFIEGVATIECFGVVPEHRRRGIGRALLAAGLNAAWANEQTTQVRQIWHTEHPGYLDVYLGMGFELKYAIHGYERKVSGAALAG